MAIMRIGVDARPLTSESTGLRTYAINIVRALLKRPEIELYLYTNNKSSLLELIPSGEQCAIRELFNLKGLSRHLLLPYWAKRDKLDYMLFLCNSSWWYFGCKTAIVVHDLIPDVFPDIFLNTRTSRVTRYFQKLAYKHADILVTGSRSAQKQISKTLNILEAKIQVIYHGLQSNLTNNAEPNDEDILKKYALFQQDYFLYVGSLDIRKNISSLIIAYAALVKNHCISHKLALTGTPPQSESKRYPNFLALVKDLDIEDKVIFLGTVDDSELPALFRHADVFVFPSLYEGFGLPPLEAMACGTPVVCSNVLPMTEILGEGAYYVDSTQTDKITKGILDVLLNKSLRNDLVTRGLQHSKQFTWENAGKQLADLFVTASKTSGKDI